MRAFAFFVLITFHTFSGSAQKLVKKTLISPENEFIQIDAKNCYRVDMETSHGKELIVEASIEGEYEKDLVIKVEGEDNNILVSVGFRPNFNAPNDKLSAHKVISVALKITIPEYKAVRLYGTNSDIFAKGNYMNLLISLTDGNCTLKTIKETIAVKTQKGNIDLFTTKGEIKAKSHYGKVVTASIPHGQTSYVLNSVEGNIRVIKTE